MHLVLLQLIQGSGLVESVAQTAAVLSTLVMLLILVGLGTYAYKHLRDDGIEWPDEEEADGPDGVQRGDSDDEWKYY
jgi:hypothetical protein